MSDIRKKRLHIFEIDGKKVVKQMTSEEKEKFLKENEEVKFIR